MVWAVRWDEHFRIDLQTLCQLSCPSEVQKSACSWPRHRPDVKLQSASLPGACNDDFCLGSRVTMRSLTLGRGMPGLQCLDRVQLGVPIEMATVDDPTPDGVDPITRIRSVGNRDEPLFNL